MDIYHTRNVYIFKMDAKQLRKYKMDKLNKENYLYADWHENNISKPDYFTSQASIEKLTSYLDFPLLIVHESIIYLKFKGKLDNLCNNILKYFINK